MHRRRLWAEGICINTSSRELTEITRLANTSTDDSKRNILRNRRGEAVAKTIEHGTVLK
jgi:hypothetical protein